MKDAAEIQFKALNKCYEIARNKTRFDVDLYKFWVETYYQSTLVIFGSEAFTAYKLKLDIVWRLVESGNISLPWNHMTEGSENSHHTANKDYHSKTMRDGGISTRHLNSSYLDLYFSYMRAVNLSMEGNFRGRNDAQSEEYESLLEKWYLHRPKANCTPETYLKICGQAVPRPTLRIGKKEPSDELFRGMTFTTLGNISKNISPGNNLTTLIQVRKLIKQMGGHNLLSTTLQNIDGGYLPSHYCIFNDQIKFEIAVGEREPAKTKKTITSVDVISLRSAMSG